MFGPAKLPRRRFTAALALAGALVCLLVGAVPGVARMSLGSRSLDALRSDDARGCAKRPQPGALALESWMARHWIGESWGILSCRHVERTSQWSLHAEGRGLDWRLDAAIPEERAAADRLIARLLAPDAQGRPFARARRMGLQEIIFNCRIWQADGLGMGRYGLCRHRPHGRKRKPIDRTIEHLRPRPPRAQLGWRQAPRHLLALRLRSGLSGRFHRAGPTRWAQPRQVE